ncbi:GntR family transcriptional regulator [Ancylomarina salipaludis]|uniref:GntR family transcriptional regulator n=1 Tax=Ancylomarina salipaludis TaxID=2501299 RepID=A0A4Q1JLD8_9BACT|nr:GntR family transcriptional regulator [Ancylomarina salipaludis]RXQ94528.1 GntR family transcriptional regulator [Ancylomarina salipaludis]
MLNQIFKISSDSGIPKYKQLINSLLEAIETGVIQKADRLPSINAICKEFTLSRDTVLVAFNELKARGVISSVPGKGYYVESTVTQFKHKIFLLFDELNAFKEVLYNSFLESLKGQAVVDIYFHHFNRQVFKDLIDASNGAYTSYVIMPAKFNDAYSILSQLPQDKVYILDQTNASLKKYYPSVHQNFEKDIFSALSFGLKELEKYQKLILVFPGGKEPLGQMKGFQKFCHKYEDKWEGEVIASLHKHPIKKGEVYIVPSDKDLVALVKTARSENLKLGVDLGIISYNDTPLKEVVADGITTISTDFAAMGEHLAHMVLNKENLQLENQSSLIRRKSL